MKRLLTIRDRIIASTVARDSMIVFTGTMAGNVASYLYHLYLGRALGPAAYGELSSIISLLYIFGVVTLVWQTTLTKFFSEYKARGDDSAARHLAVRTLRFLGYSLGAGLIIIIALAPLTVGFLHLGSARFIVWGYLAFAVSTLAMVFASVFQGYQLFVLFSAYVALSGIIRLTLSIPAAAGGVEWVLVSWVASSAILFALPVFFLRWLFSAAPYRGILKIRGVIIYSLPAFAALLGLTSLFSTDVIMARHFLPADQAGLYAAIAVLGKIIFYATSSIGAVVFPKVAERVATGKIYRKIVGAGLILVGAGSLILTALYFVIPELVIRMLFGTGYLTAAPYLGTFAVFISLFCLGYILVMTNLAAGNTGIWIIPIIMAFVQVLFISLRHENAGQIISVNFFVSFLFLVSVAAATYFNLKKYHGTKRE
ncbi:hypothetical protein A2Z33_05465 [Candidatus Gottesmanbacteria bacterium RBG_16_52_11]|uniref:Polysaccharide biosynthesis protein C-terminal domain-containing protein n=1 Tax=Candidatus Gottesmanbacteria bacterium RBG_16_52_11 TaxID=1798374 RepID=A0A1F5YNP9_9BACT|nr:MAG: hypothetical protein A2Z33_05465 [Candidatus Gottesmanbacteria bacterium RBG_16_52_11]